MKKATIIFTAALLLFASFAFATDNVSAKVRTAFLNDFATASEVSWERTDDYYLASFTINDFDVTAAYNEAGELIATSRVIEYVQLPLSVSLALSKKYKGYNFSKKVTEMDFEGSTRYYLNAENDRQLVKLKCSANGNIEVDKKLKKK